MFVNLHLNNGNINSTNFRHTHSAQEEDKLGLALMDNFTVLFIIKFACSILPLTTFLILIQAKSLVAPAGLSL